MAACGRCGWAPSITMGQRRRSLLLLVVAIGATLVCAADGVSSGRRPRGERLKKRENAIFGNQNGERAKNEAIWARSLVMHDVNRSRVMAGKHVRYRRNKTVTRAIWILRENIRTDFVTLQARWTRTSSGRPHRMRRGGSRPPTSYRRTPRRDSTLSRGPGRRVRGRPRRRPRPN